MNYQNALVAEKLTLQDFRLSEVKFFLLTACFIVGNLILPMAFHSVPMGGRIFLPMYFFTLVGAYAFGWRMGLMISVGSLLFNNLLTGMPTLEMLPIVGFKMTVLAIFAALFARRSGKIGLFQLVVVILAYQAAGGLLEFALAQNFTPVFREMKIQLPGLVLQLIGGFFVLKAINRYAVKKS